jgi:DNA segregation ATPase FtsK/SpoIIIE, S-DNA-T family
LPLTFGIILISLSLFMIFAFISYLFEGRADQDLVVSQMDQDIRSTAEEARNWLGLLGAQISHLFIHKWFGIAAFLFPPFIFLLGFQTCIQKIFIFPFQICGICTLFYFLALFAYWIPGSKNIRLPLDRRSQRRFRNRIGTLADNFLGWGTFLLIGGSLLIFIVYYFNIDQFNWFLSSDKNESIEQDLEKPIASSPFNMDNLDEDGEFEGLEEEDIEDDGNSWTIKSDEKTSTPTVASPIFNIEGESGVNEESYCQNRREKIFCD